DPSLASGSSPVVSPTGKQRRCTRPERRGRSRLLADCSAVARASPPSLLKSTGRDDGHRSVFAPHSPPVEACSGLPEPLACGGLVAFPAGLADNCFRASGVGCSSGNPVGTVCPSLYGFEESHIVYFSFSGTALHERAEGKAFSGIG